MLDFNKGSTDNLSILSNLRSNESDTLRKIDQFIVDIDYDSSEYLQQSQYVLLAMLEYQASDPQNEILSEKIKGQIKSIAEGARLSGEAEGNNFMQRLVSTQVSGKQSNLVGLAIENQDQAAFSELQEFFDRQLQQATCLGPGYHALKSTQEGGVQWLELLEQSQNCKAELTVTNAPHSEGIICAQPLVKVAIKENMAELVRPFVERNIIDPNLQADFGLTTLLFLEESIQHDKHSIKIIKDGLGGDEGVDVARSLAEEGGINAEKYKQIIEKFDGLETKVNQQQELFGKLKANAPDIDTQIVNLNQGQVCNKIREYVKWHNQQNPGTQFKIPYDAEKGWCSGLTSMWAISGVSAQTDGKQNAFFNNINNIVSSDFDNLTQDQHHDILYFVEQASLAQARFKDRTANGLDQYQWDINKQLGLEQVDRLQFICADESELKSIIEHYAKNHPNTFNRLDFPGHSTGFYYDDQSDKIHYYDANQMTGNIAVDLDSGKTLTSELELSLDDFVKSIPIHSLTGDFQNLPICIETYKQAPQIQPEEVNANIQSRESLLTGLLEKRKENGIPSDINLSPDNGSTSVLSMAVERNDLEAVKYFIQNGMSLETPDNILFSKAQLAGQDMTKTVFEGYINEKKISGLDDTKAKQALSDIINSHPPGLVGKTQSPLGRAIAEKKHGVVDEMINQGNIDLVNPCYGAHSPLVTACLNKDSKMIECLSLDFQDLSVKDQSDIEQKLVEILAGRTVQEGGDELDPKMELAVEMLSPDLPDKVRDKIIENLNTPEINSSDTPDKGKQEDPDNGKQLALELGLEHNAKIDKKKPRLSPENRPFALKFGIAKLIAKPEETDMHNLLEMTKSSEKQLLFSRFSQKRHNRADLRGKTDVLTVLDAVKQYFNDTPPSSEENRTLLRGYVLSLQEEKGYTHQSKVGTLLTEVANQVEELSQKCGDVKMDNDECKQQYQEKAKQPDKLEQSAQQTRKMR